METHPLVPDDTAENRSKNRRVDIVVLNGGAAATQPQQMEVSQP